MNLTLLDAGSTLLGVGIAALLIGLLIAAVIGALILWLLAKNVGKIENASFGNSFLVCLAAGVGGMILNIITASMGLTFIKLGLVGFAIVSIVITSLCYIVAGKLIWKTSWEKSIKANIIWIALYAGWTIYSANAASSLLGGA